MIASPITDRPNASDALIIPYVGRLYQIVAPNTAHDINQIIVPKSKAPVRVFT